MLGSACGIKYQCAAVWSLFIGIRLVSRVIAIAFWGMILRMIINNDHLIGLSEDLFCQPFSEFNQKRRRIWLLFLKTRKSYKVLVIQILHNLLHKFSIGVAVLLLNDQRFKRHSQRFGGNTGLTRKQFGVAILDIIPRDDFGFPAPPAIGIHFQADGLVKISKVELMESIFFVHRLYSKVQGF